jgi:malate synthase
VREDKTREARDGFDGSWVAHPDLVPIAQPIFDEAFGASPNQLGRLREDVSVDPGQLIDLSGIDGAVTTGGLRADVDVGVRYLAAWLSGNGAAAIHNLMEDAATAEISRSQIWQWVHGQVKLADTGETVTAQMVRGLLDELAFDDPNYAAARAVFEQVALADDFEAFLTTPAYALID